MDNKKVLSDKDYCLRKNKKLFCCRATWDGWHIWKRHDYPTLMAWGKTPALSWRQCRINILSDKKYKEYLKTLK